MGTDLFVYHGYAELFLDGKWVKATPAFNVEAVPALSRRSRSNSTAAKTRSSIRSTRTTAATWNT